MDENALTSTPNPPVPEQMPAGSNALQSAPQVGSAGMQLQAPAPAPTHAQTVAALRHFHAIQEQLHQLLENPALGKSSVKSEIISGTTKLVSERILSAPEAVAQLAKVPDDPQAQRKWVQAMMQQAFQASEAVLGHRQQAVANGLAPADHGGVDYHSDDHAGHMGALAAQFGEARR